MRMQQKNLSLFVFFLFAAWWSHGAITTFGSIWWVFGSDGTSYWDDVVSCPPSSYLTAIRLTPSGSTEKLTGIEIKCLFSGAEGGEQNILVGKKNPGKNWTEWLVSPLAASKRTGDGTKPPILTAAAETGHFAVGWQTKTEKAVDAATGPVSMSTLLAQRVLNIGLLFSSFVLPVFLQQKDATATNSTIISRQFQCPAEEAMCSIRTNRYLTRNGGWIIDVQFGCCYYCVPEEVYATLQSFSNEGYTPTTHQARSLVGKQDETRKTAGESHSTTQSQDTEIGQSKTTTKESGFSLFVSMSTTNSLQSSFSRRFGSSSTSGYNWETSQSSMFTQQKEETFTYTCEPQKKCSLRQVIGKCGKITILTPHVSKLSEPLYKPRTSFDGNLTVDYRGQDTSYPPIQCGGPSKGEFSCIEGNASDDTALGYWQRPGFCPEGSIATGFQLQLTDPVSDLQLTDPVHEFLLDVALHCSVLLTTDSNGTSSKVRSPPIAATVGSWWTRGENRRLNVTVKNYGSKGHNPAIGLAVKALQIVDGTITNLAMTYKGEENIEIPKVNFFLGHWSKEFSRCPVDHAVCGIQTKVSDHSPNYRALRRIRLKCCFFCIPEERWVTINSIDNGGFTEMAHETRIMVGTRNELNVQTSGSTSLGEAYDHETLKNGFAAKFGSSSTEGFNWGNTLAENWYSETTKSLTFTCEPRHNCVIKQLVGVCGLKEIKTSYWKKETVALDDFVPTTTVPPPYVRDFVEIGGGNDISRLHQNVQTGQKLAESLGVWDTPKFCPENWLINGFRVKIHPNSNVGLRQISIRCFPMTQSVATGPKIYGQDQSKGNNSLIIEAGVEEKEGGKAKWSKMFEFVPQDDDDENGNHQPATGFAVQMKTFSKTPAVSRSNYLVNFGLMFKGSEASIEAPGVDPRQANRLDLWTEIFKCPAERAACGVQTKIHTTFPSKKQVTSVRIQCCPHCTPIEEESILDTFYNHGDTETSYSITTTRNVQDDRRWEQTLVYNQAGHAAKFGGRHVNTFNRGETTTSTMGNQTDNVVQYTCEPKHACFLKRVVQKCGDNVTSSRIVKEIVPLFVDGGEGVGFEKRFGAGGDVAGLTGADHVIDLGGIIYEGQGQEGWQPAEFCPDDWIVTGFQLKVRKVPIAQLTGISLQCSMPEGKDQTTVDPGVANKTVGLVNATVQTEDQEGKWTNLTMHSLSNGSLDNDTVRPAIGFIALYKIWNPSLAANSILDFALVYTTKNVVVNENGEEPGSQWMGPLFCPTHTTICGIQSKEWTTSSKNFFEDGLTLLADVRLKCCFSCVPREEVTILESLVNMGVTPTTLRIDMTTGLQRQKELSPFHILYVQRAFSENKNFWNGSLLHGFSWTDASLSMWNEAPSNRTLDFVCDAGHSCVVKQLLGICGPITFKTPHIIRHSHKISRKS